MTRKQLFEMLPAVDAGQVSLADFADALNSCGLEPCDSHVRGLRCEQVNDRWMVARVGNIQCTFHDTKERAEAYMRRFAVVWAKQALWRCWDRDRRLVAKWMQQEGKR